MESEVRHLAGSGRVLGRVEGSSSGRPERESVKEGDGRLVRGKAAALTREGEGKVAAVGDQKGRGVAAATAVREERESGGSGVHGDSETEPNRNIRFGSVYLKTKIIITILKLIIILIINNIKINKIKT